MTTADPRRGLLGAIAKVFLVLGLAVAAIPLAPGVARAEGEVPAGVVYATNPQAGVGNSFSSPYQWWKLALNEGDTVRAQLKVTSEAGDDVYLRLYLPGTTHQSQNSRVADGVQWEHTATQTGDYLFCVFSFDYSNTSYEFSWVRTVAPVAPPVTPAIQTQSATVTLPKSIKYRGKTVLLKKAVTTNAGQLATSKITVSPSGKKYARVTTTSTGKVTIKTRGKKALRVTLKLSAPAKGQFTAYSYTKTWKVRK